MAKVEEQLAKSGGSKAGGRGGRGGSGAGSKGHSVSGRSTKEIYLIKNRHKSIGAGSHLQRPIPVLLREKSWK